MKVLSFQYIKGDKLEKVKVKIGTISYFYENFELDENSLPSENPQWLMKAYDIEKKEERIFEVKYVNDVYIIDEKGE